MSRMISATDAEYQRARERLLAAIREQCFEHEQADWLALADMIAESQIASLRSSRVLSCFRERPVIRYGLKVELFRRVSQFDPTVMSLRSRRQNPR